MYALYLIYFSSQDIQMPPTQAAETSCKHCRLLNAKRTTRLQMTSAGCVLLLTPHSKARLPITTIAHLSSPIDQQESQATPCLHPRSRVLSLVGAFSSSSSSGSCTGWGLRYTGSGTRGGGGVHSGGGSRSKGSSPMRARSSLMSCLIPSSRSRCSCASRLSRSRISLAGNALGLSASSTCLEMGILYAHSASGAGGTRRGSLSLKKSCTATRALLSNLRVLLRWYP